MRLYLFLGLKSSLPDRYIGFKECQDEVMRFLVEVEGWDAADRLCIMLMAHLEQAGEKFRIMNGRFSLLSTVSIKLGILALICMMLSLTLNNLILMTLKNRTLENYGRKVENAGNQLFPPFTPNRQAMFILSPANAFIVEKYEKLLFFRQLNLMMENTLDNIVGQVGNSNQCIMPLS